jgi:hypothetical protein
VFEQFTSKLQISAIDQRNFKVKFIADIIGIKITAEVTTLAIIYFMLKVKK